MSDNEAIREGGCLCGALRYRVTGEPFRTNTCHCTGCRRRTGSAFGISTYFKIEQVDFISGERKVYRYQSDESGRFADMEFCPDCGSTVTWTAEFFPGARGIAGGSFDDPDWFDVDQHGWARSALKHTCFPDSVAVYQQAIPLPAQSVE